MSPSPSTATHDEAGNLLTSVHGGGTDPDAEATSAHAERYLTDVEEVAAAEQEAAEAEALITTLEERAIEGDPDVTPEQIDAQRGLARFAKLRRDGAKRKAARLFRESVLAEDAALAQRVAAVAAHRTADLTGPARAARDALLALVSAVDARNTEVTDLAQDLRALRSRAHEGGLLDEVTVQRATGAVGVEVDEHQVVVDDAGQVVAAVLASATSVRVREHLRSPNGLLDAPGMRQRYGLA